MSNQPASANRIKATLAAIMTLNPDKAEQAKANPMLRGWFSGQVMMHLKGAADMQAVHDVVDAALVDLQVNSPPPPASPQAG